MKVFSTIQAARMFGVDFATLNQWISAGLVPVRQKSKGSGNRRSVDMCGLLCIGIISSLRRRGQSLSSIKPACEWLATTTEDDLLAAFAEGRTRLVWSGESFGPRLVSPSTPVLNDSGYDVVITAMELETCYRLCIAKMEADAIAIAVS